MSALSQNIVSRYVHRRVLLFTLIALATLFAITAAPPCSQHAREEGLVTEWHERGKKDLAAGKPAAALENFRNSLSYGPATELEPVMKPIETRYGENHS